MKSSVKTKQAKFKSGMVLGGNSHNIIIPSFHDPALLELNKKLNEEFNIQEDVQSAEIISEFVGDEFEYEDPSELFHPYTGVQMKDEVPLDIAIRCEKGRCKEQAATLQMLNQMNGIESRFMKGHYPTENEDGELEYGRHAWVKVQLNGEEFYADPTNDHSDLMNSSGKMRKI